MKEFISVQPTNDWTKLCRDCHKLLKSNSFVVKIYHDKWDDPDPEVFYLCNKCLRILYPRYFQDNSKKKKL